jgi:dTDP-4-dehydrorhamnose 3,5-epimerase
LRGPHRQAAPYFEAKLIQCTRGAFDVAVDVPSGSSARRLWHAVELPAENRQILCIPKDFADGFQISADEIDYFITFPKI